MLFHEVRARSNAAMLDTADYCLITTDLFLAIVRNSSFDSGALSNRS